MTSSNQAYVRKFVRNKSDPLVERVTIIHPNPYSTLVRFSDGRQDTVATKDLAPFYDTSHTQPLDINEVQRLMPTFPHSSTVSPNNSLSSFPSDRHSLSSPLRAPESPVSDLSSPTVEVEPSCPGGVPAIRRSYRLRCPPTRLQYEKLGSPS